MPAISSKVRIGIIGSGRAALKYAVPGLAAHPQAEIAAVTSRSPENARKLAEQISPCPVVYPTWREMVRDGNIDAVVICSPPASHYEMALHALVRRKHVMVEKPALLPGNDGWWLRRSASFYKKIVMVHQNLRFSPAIWKAKFAIDCGLIGDIRRIIALFEHPGPGKDWFFQREISGGGAFLDLGIHLTDAIRFLAGYGRMEIGTPHLEYAPGAEVENYGRASFSMADDGIAGTIIASWKAERVRGKLWVFGEKGRLEVTFRPVEEEAVVRVDASNNRTNITLGEVRLINPFYYFIERILGNIEQDEMRIEIGANLCSLSPLLAALKQS